MKPYYEADGVTIYHGDCREILPQLEPVDAVITDPVWPNAGDRIVGHERPYELLAEVAPELPRLCERAVFHIGCNSDPRLLACVPHSMPFLRACWLEYAIPHFTGHVLNGSDVAYVFGLPPRRRPGKKVIPGRSPKAQPGDTCRAHPCSRSLTMVTWLVDWFSVASVIDPFMGSGTTLLAAKNLRRQAIGIEIVEKHCETAARRLDQTVMELEA